MGHVVSPFCKPFRAVRTFCKTPVICSYFPVELGKFSKLITGEMSREKLSGFGSLENGEALFKIGVPKQLFFTMFCLGDPFSGASSFLIVSSPTGSIPNCASSSLRFDSRSFKAVESKLGSTVDFESVFNGIGQFELSSVLTLKILNQ